MAEAPENERRIDRAGPLAGGAVLAFAAWVLIHPIAAVPFAAAAAWKVSRR